MKLFTNLPGSLRVLFGTLRLLAVVTLVLVLLAFTCILWAAKQSLDKPKFMVTVGEVLLPAGFDPVRLESDGTNGGAIVVGSLRGTLQMDLVSKNAELVSALCWTTFPAIAVIFAFYWVLLGSLRNVCANIERGEVFSERNLRLVRNIGVTLIAYSLAGGAVVLWSGRVMNGYLSHHVALAGMQSGEQFADGVGALRFMMPPGLFSFPGDIVTGCVVLLISEVFRQGLNLKTENDLTV